MRLLLLLLLSWAYFPNQAEATNCAEASIEECKETEYNSYVTCLRRRMKRSLDCENSIQEPCNNCEQTCQECDCDYCAVNSCQQICTSCCPNNPPCATNRCCHKSCHAKCKSSTCRSECRKSCTEKVNNGNKTSSTNITSSEKSHHNITTIINLHNVINNTNIIDVPIQVNNTNINNITLSGPPDSKLTENINITTNETIKENCCYVVGPRQCTQTEKYPYIRCFHLRKKVCGAFCRAPIVHEQQHNICDQTPTGTTCQQRLLYIPQPQPRCAYQQSWPYVSCGLQPQRSSCGGCYLHYSSPFPQLPPPGCSSGCYDDGFGVGPYYRQGPFYRPGYAHVPSCYQIGSCGLYGYGGYPNPYGGFPSPYGGGGFPNPYGGGGGFPNPYGGGGGFPNPYGGGGGFAYPPPGFGGFPPFPGVGYPPNTYENNVHLEPIPETNVQNSKDETQNTSNTQVEVEEPPPSYLPIPFIPQYSSIGYPYIPQNPTYNLPPEVDIQATITHPEKESRYAQITITKRPSKRENAKKDKIENAISKDTKEVKEEKIDKEENEKDVDDKEKEVEKIEDATVARVNTTSE